MKRIKDIIHGVRLSEALLDALVPEGKGFISITGGGGKTTLMSLLGREAAEHGLSVLITTTTKVASPYLHDYGADCIFDSESILGEAPEKGKLCFYAEHHTLDMKKWISPREDVLTVLGGIYDLVISEADGSRGLPLKIHTDRDPVIHPLTTAVVAVMGLWGLGEKAYSSVFGEERDTLVDKDYIQWYLRNPEGLTKGFVGRNAILFNGSENVGKNTLSMLSTLEYPADTAVFAASEKENRIYGIIQ